MTAKVDSLSVSQNITFLKPQVVGTLACRNIMVETDAKTPINFQELKNVDEKINFAKKNIEQLKDAFKKKEKDPDHIKAIGFTRELFDDIIKLTKKPLEEYTAKDLERIDDGLSLLSKVDGQFSDAYQGILLRFLYDRKDFKNLANIYQDQILKTKETLPTEAKELKAWIDSHQENIPKEILKIKAVAYEDAMLKELEDFIKIKDKKTLRKEQPAEIEQFLLHAYANSSLNQRLQSKKANKSKAEQFISDYTYATLGSKKAVKAGKPRTSELKKSVTEITKSLSTPIGGSSLRNICQSLVGDDIIIDGKSSKTGPGIEQLERDLSKEFNELRKPKMEEGEIVLDENKNIVYVAKEEKNTTLVEELDKFFKMYSNDTPVWTTRRSPELLKQAEAIVKAATDIGHGDNRVVANRARMFNAKMKETNKTIEAFLNNKNPHRLPYESLGVVTTFDELIDSLRGISELCSSFSGCHVLEDLVKSCNEAEDVMNDIRLLSEVTDSYKGGDIMLKDEVLYKNFVESSRMPYSQFSVFKNMGDLKHFAEDLKNKKIWDVQPYFTGDKTHARMIFPAEMVNSSTTKTISSGRGHAKKRKKVAEGNEFIISKVKKEIRESPFNEIKKEKKNKNAENLLTQCALTLTTTAFENKPTRIDNQKTITFAIDLKTTIESMSIRDAEDLGIKELLKKTAELYKEAKPYNDTSIIRSIDELSDAKVAELTKILNDGMTSIVDSALTDIMDKSIYTSQTPRNIDLTNLHGVDISPTAITSSMYEVQWRPQFDKLLDPSLEGKISKTEVEKIFAKKLQKRVEEPTPWRELENIQIDQTRAARSFFVGLGLTHTLKQFIAIVWDWLFGPQGKLRFLIDSSVSKAQTPEEANTIVKDVNKRFCSEIISTLLRESLQDTEEEIIKEINKKEKNEALKLKEGTPCLKKIFPAKLDDSWIHPNMLEELLKKSECFEKIGTPKLMTQLFEPISHEWKK